MKIIGKHPKKINDPILDHPAMHGKHWSIDYGYGPHTSYKKLFKRQIDEFAVDSMDTWVDTKHNDVDIGYREFYDNLDTEQEPEKVPSVAGVDIDIDEPALNEKDDRCTRIAKSKYKTWPSAYACVPEKNTQALTKTGWKSVDQLKLGEEILTHNLQKDVLEFSPILNIHRYKNADTVIVQSGNTGFIFESTKNHKWVIKLPDTKSTEYKKFERINNFSLIETEKILNNPNNKLLVVTAPYHGGDLIKIYNYHYTSNERYKNTEDFKLVSTNSCDVWCPETENGTWVVKQETENREIITITGNSGAVVRCRKGEIWKETADDMEERKDFSKEKSQGLHGWFARRGGKGGKGWVDCNTCRKGPSGKKICKSCGRQAGEKRSKYPACRPTPSQCTNIPNKTGSKRVSWKKENTIQNNMKLNETSHSGTIITGQNPTGKTNINSGQAVPTGLRTGYGASQPPVTGTGEDTKRMSAPYDFFQYKADNAKFGNGNILDAKTGKVKLMELLKQVLEEMREKRKNNLH